MDSHESKATPAAGRLAYLGMLGLFLCAVLTRRLVGATKFGLLAPLLIAILFGAINFAARRSRFHEMPEFAQL